MSLMRRLYGGHPLHLLALLACFALAGAALLRFFDAGPLRDMALWLGGAIVLHDLVAFPLYATADRLAAGAGRAMRARGAPDPINYLRVPTILSALLLAISFPLVLRQAPLYERTTGLELEVFLGRWLGISGALFAASAALYAVAALRARRRR
jgi:hypothetical protein